MATCAFHAMIPWNKNTLGVSDRRRPLRTMGFRSNAARRKRSHDRFIIERALKTSIGFTQRGKKRTRFGCVNDGGSIYDRFVERTCPAGINWNRDSDLMEYNRVIRYINRCTENNHWEIERNDLTRIDDYYIFELKIVGVISSNYEISFRHK